MIRGRNRGVERRRCSDWSPALAGDGALCGECFAQDDEDDGLQPLLPPTLIAVEWKRVESAKTDAMVSTVSNRVVFNQKRALTDCT